MARRLPALDDVVELGIDADAIVADEQTRGNFGMGIDESTNERGDRVRGVGDAEDDLVFGIVERENRGQRLSGERLDAAQRLDDRDQGEGRPEPPFPAASFGTARQRARRSGREDRDRSPLSRPRRRRSSYLVPTTRDRVAALYHIAAAARRFYEGACPRPRSSVSRPRPPGASTSATRAPRC